MGAIIDKITVSIISLVTGINSRVKTVFLLVALCLSACGSPEPPSLDKVSQHLESDQLRSALIEVRNFLSESPDSAEARLLMGRIHLMAADPAAAEQEFIKARELGAAPDKLMPELGKSLLRQQKLDELRSLSLDGLGPEAVADVEASLVMAELAEGQIEGAKSLLDSMPPEVSPYNQLVRAHYFNTIGEQSRARQLLESILETAPGYYLAWALKGDIAAAGRNFEQAEDFYSSAITHNRHDHSLYLKRAIARVQLQELDKAEEDLVKIEASRYQNSPTTHYIKGVVAHQQGDREQAIKSFEVASQNYRQYPQALLYLGQLHFDQNNLSQAEEYLEQYLSENDDSAEARKLLASINLKQGEVGLARSYIEPLLAADSGDTFVLGVLSEAYLQEGDTDKAIDTLQSMVADNPQLESARMGLGVGYIKAGDPASAAETFEELVQSSPDSLEANKYLVLSLLAAGNPDKAARFAQEYHDRHPDSFESHNMLGLVRLAEDRQDAAVEAFERSLSLNPAGRFAGIRLAAMAAERGEPDKAKAYLQGLIKADKNDYRSMVDLARLYLQEGDTESFLQQLNRAVEVNSQVLSPRMMLAEYYFFKDQNDRVATAFVGMPEDLKSNEGYLKLMALNALAQEEYTGALHYLERLQSQHGESHGLHYNLARVYGAQGDNPRMEKHLARALELKPDSYPSGLAMAKYQLTNNKPEQAGPLVERLRNAHPDNPEVMQLAVLWHRQKGDLGSALRLSRELFSARPSSVNALSLASLLWDAGEKDNAQKHLSNWLAANPDDQASRRILSRFYLLNGESSKAIEHLKRILKESPDDVETLNNLAWALREANPSRAVDYAQQASRLRPDSAEVLDTLAVAYWKSGNLEKAKDAAAKALAQSPDNASIVYHNAAIGEARGDREYALSLLKPLLAKSGQFPEHREARQLYEKLANL